MNTNNAAMIIDKEIELIKKLYFPTNAKAYEMEFCLNVAKSLGLNPLRKEIFFISRKAQLNGQWVDKIEPLCSRDGFLALAHRSSKFNGMKTTSSIQTTPKYVDGKWIEQKDLVAVCEVYRKDMDLPFVVEVAFSEYAAKTNGGQLTKFWLEKPDTMLKKVAESQALRKAFNLHGIYAYEEINDLPSDFEIPTSNETQAQIVDCSQDTSESLMQEQNQNNTISNNSNCEANEFAVFLQQNQLNLCSNSEIEWLSGNNIFYLKEAIKKYGFRWNPSQKIWARPLCA